MRNSETDDRIRVELQKESLGHAPRAATFMQVQELHLQFEFTEMGPLVATLENPVSCAAS